MDLPSADQLHPDRLAATLAPMPGLNPALLEAAAALVPAVVSVPSASWAYGKAWRAGDAAVQAGGREVQPNTLWCTCGQRSPCPHVVAVLIVEKWREAGFRKRLEQPSWLTRLEPVLVARTAATLGPSGASLVFTLSGADGARVDLQVVVVRAAKRGGAPLKPTPLPRDLAKFTELAGALEAPDRALHHALFGLDAAKTAESRGARGLSPLIDDIYDRLLPLLARPRDRVWIDGVEVRVDPEPVRPTLAIRRDGERVFAGLDPAATRWWRAGSYGWVLLVGSPPVLRPLAVDFPPEARGMLVDPRPIELPPADLPWFVDEVMVRRGVQVELASDAGVATEPSSRTAQVWLAEQGATLTARLGFVYRSGDAEGRVDADRSGTALVAGRAVVRRDPAWETEARDAFGDIVGQENAIAVSGDDALDFLADTLPRLRERFGILGEAGLLGTRYAGRLAARVGLESGIDWFDLQVEFALEDGRQVPAADVLRAWTSGRRYVALGDGALARLPSRWLTRHGDAAAELADVRRAAGRLGAFALPLAEGLLDEIAAPPAWKAALRELADGDRIPPREPPPGLVAQLRPYQHEGYRWLVFLRDRGLGAVLADDMGLGKTLQALASIADAHRTPGLPSLVVAPTSVLHGWASEAAKFAPGLRVHVHHGAERGPIPAAVDLVVTSYALLRLDPAIADRDWRGVVLDEAQAIKNHDSQVSRAARGLRAAWRLALTGTPVENRLAELWSLFDFLMPGFFGALRGFQHRYAWPIERERDAEAAARLRARIRPFILRRLKSQVATELPPRQVVELRCELSPGERALYERIRDTYRESVRRHVEEQGVARSTIVILEALTRLRQACAHPALLPFPEAAETRGSTKLDVLLEHLDAAIADGHKSLVFSQWPTLLGLVRAALAERGVAVAWLDGTTRDRAAVVERFQADDGPPVFLISLKAGGTGLNLTAADHVFHLDPWWNPAVEDQATDRAHRIGQTRPVMVYRLIAADTVEDKVMALQLRKRAVADAAIVAEEDLVATIGGEDLLAVLDA